MDQAFKRRRQRPISCFRNSSANSRSAPASPSALGGNASGLVTPDSLSREPSPSPDAMMDNDMVGLMGPPPASSFLSLPNTDYKLSSKSAPGSPGGGKFCISGYLYSH